MTNKFVGVGHTSDTCRRQDVKDTTGPILFFGLFRKADHL